MIKRNGYAIFLLFTLLSCIIFTGFITGVSIIKNAYAGDIPSYNHSSSYLSIKVKPSEPEPPEPPEPGPGPGPPSIELKPIIYWYDFQNSEGISKLNSKIDVNKRYKFCIGIRSDQGWDDIDYIDITAWFDNGDDSTTYNNSGNRGGNLNMFLRYENTTDIAKYKLIYPDVEVIKGSFTEKNVPISDIYPESTECRCLTFTFIPSYQFRYAPGDGIWGNTTNTFDDKWSWNFRISVTDSGEDASGPNTASINDEFGVHPYAEIVSAGMPSMQGYPGDNASTESNIVIITRSNVEYSLSVNVNTFFHKTHPTANISNQTIWIRGGTLNKFTNFIGKPIYLYGSSITYIEADDNNTTKITKNIDYSCTIPLAQFPGNYSSRTFYYLKTKT
jgi:hypothetical protein